MEKTSAQNSSTKSKRFFWQIVIINLSAIIVVTLLNYVQVGWENAFSRVSLLSTVINSNCIGTLCGIVITRSVLFFRADAAILRLVKLAGALFAATLLGVVISNIILNVFFDIKEGGAYFLPNFNKIIFSLIIAFSFGLSSYFYEVSQIKLRQKEIDEANAKTLATEAQLASLESRIHPHFLFNTLNSIAALIREDPILAEKTVEKLSALLRYSLDSNAKSLVSLKQEIEITEKYLEIEKVRFDERLNYKIEVSEKLANVKLPPLALQTLVENSIKHVTSKSSGRTDIKVLARQNGADIIIEVWDSGTGFSSDAIQEGHGLDILQKRLSVIFQKKAKLEIVGNGTVKIKIPNNIQSVK